MTTTELGYLTGVLAALVTALIAVAAGLITTCAELRRRIRALELRAGNGPLCDDLLGEQDRTGPVTELRN